MSSRGPGSFSRQTLLACVLLGGLLPLAGAAPGKSKAKEADAQDTEIPTAPLLEPFQKGPVSLSAKVTRNQGATGTSVLPLFQVPVLAFQDKLDLAFSGEAFDQRVTSADWSLIVVFLPKTIAPTDQGVVAFRLKRKDGKMMAPSISVPYDSIPMIFLVPDKNGRRKVLQDLNDHLEAFRTLCAKISSLSEERAVVDKFMEDLDAIDKNLSPVQYDNSVLSFLHAYGNPVAGDLQGFLSTTSNNLDKFQFLTQEFQKTNVLVPGAAAASPVTAQVAVTTGGTRPISAYVSIVFDLAAIIQNLWPGHQFQYLPALARDFHGDSADLYYSDWIHTTGDTLGALMCCPGSWEDQTPPVFGLDLPAGESLLKKEALLKVRLKEKSRPPFALYGHDWKLLVVGPKGEALPPLPLASSPSKQSFAALPVALREPLRKLGAARVKAHVVGRWGFTSIATEPFELPAGCDPAWMPTAEESAAFRIGNTCTFKLPGSWASVVEAVSFRPAKAGAAVLVARFMNQGDGSREAILAPKQDAGPGTLEIRTFGTEVPALSRPLTLAQAPPEVAGLEVRLGEPGLVLRGKHLLGVLSVELGERRFLAATDDPEDNETKAFKPVDGKPMEGSPGKQLLAFAMTVDGKKLPLASATLLPARPHFSELQVLPVASKGTGLPMTSTGPIASTTAVSQVNIIAGKGYRFPSDRAFKAAIRNADEPSETRLVPAGKLRIMGNNQKCSFTFTPSELLGGRASGKLEIQVMDDHAGSSDWLPLPAAFLDLPTINAVQAAGTGLRLLGPSLDQIEVVAASPDGPWQKASITIEEGHEVLAMTAPITSTSCYLRLFGWADLVLAVKLPPPTTAAMPLGGAQQLPRSPLQLPPEPAADQAPS